MINDRTQQWAPSPHSDLIIGPPRWNGETLVADLGRGSQKKILRVGIVEQIILEKMNGELTPSEITSVLNTEGLPISEQQVWGVINKLAVNGVISTPFAPSDTDRDPLPADSVYTPAVFSSLNLWKWCGWLGKLPIVIAVLISGLIGGVLLAHSVPPALQTIENLDWLPFLGFLAVALIWDIVVMFIHETAHSGTFYGMSGRPARLSIARFGPVILPNSQLAGVNLLPRWKKAIIIAMGPAMALTFACLPVALFQLTDMGSACHNATAMIILIETTFIALGLSFIPNADATRFIETLTGVEDLHITSFTAISGSSRIPHSLPFRSRLAIYGYPGLLLLTLVAWVAAITCAIRLAF